MYTTITCWEWCGAGKQTMRSGTFTTRNEWECSWCCLHAATHVLKATMLCPYLGEAYIRHLLASWGSGKHKAYKAKLTTTHKQHSYFIHNKRPRKMLSHICKGLCTQCKMSSYMLEKISMMQLHVTYLVHSIPQTYFSCLQVIIKIVVQPVLDQ